MNPKAHVKKHVQLTRIALVVEVEPHVRQIESYLRHSRKQTDVIERRTVLFEAVELRPTSLGSHIDFERRCDDDAEDEKSVHRSHHHRVVSGQSRTCRFCSMAILLCALGWNTG